MFYFVKDEIGFDLMRHI